MSGKCFKLKHVVGDRGMDIFWNNTIAFKGKRQDAPFFANLHDFEVCHCITP